MFINILSHKAAELISIHPLPKAISGCFPRHALCVHRTNYLAPILLASANVASLGRVYQIRWHIISRSEALLKCIILLQLPGWWKSLQEWTKSTAESINKRCSDPTLPSNMTVPQSTIVFCALLRLLSVSGKQHQSNFYLLLGLKKPR